MVDLTIVVGGVLTRRTPLAICNVSDCSSILNVLVILWAIHFGHSVVSQPWNQSDRWVEICSSCPVAVTTFAATITTDTTCSIVVACNWFIFRVQSLCLNRSYLSSMHTMIGDDRNFNANNHRRDKRDLFNLLSIITMYDSILYYIGTYFIIVKLVNLI